MKTVPTVLLMTLSLMASMAVADHALLYDGRIFFNVHVEDTNLTSARMLRIRYKAGRSFGYDRSEGRILDLTGTSAFQTVEDFVTTSVDVQGKPGAMALLRQKPLWNKYFEPYKPPLKAPTPAPTPTPMAIVVATPLPINIAPTNLALEDRIQRQMNIFLEEHENLARELQTSTSAGLITEAESKAKRIKWVEEQIRVIEKHYPLNELVVQDVKAQWVALLEALRQTGRFRSEIQAGL